MGRPIEGFLAEAVQDESGSATGVSLILMGVATVLSAGTSSGANVVPALRTAERKGPGSTIVTILCDSGLRYLSTELYRPERI